MKPPPKDDRERLEAMIQRPLRELPPQTAPRALEGRVHRRATTSARRDNWWTAAPSRNWPVPLAKAVVFAGSAGGGPAHLHGDALGEGQPRT